MKHALVLATITVAACGSEAGGPGGPPPPPVTALTADAGVIDAGITTITGYDPASGFALDPDPGTDPTRPVRANPRGARERRTVQILLRSTPIGALAQVDGQLIGKTPQLWEGEGGRPHTFTFSLTGHAPARYEFLTLTDGVVHSRLIKAVGPSPPTTTLPVPERCATAAHGAAAATDDRRCAATTTTAAADRRYRTDRAVRRRVVTTACTG
jgi:hypothetical protein